MAELNQYLSRIKKLSVIEEKARTESCVKQTNCFVVDDWHFRKTPMLFVFHKRLVRASAFSLPQFSLPQMLFCAPQRRLRHFLVVQLRKRGCVCCVLSVRRRIVCIQWVFISFPCVLECNAATGTPCVGFSIWETFSRWWAAQQHSIVGRLWRSSA